MKTLHGKIQSGAAAKRRQTGAPSGDMGAQGGMMTDMPMKKGTPVSSSRGATRRRKKG